MFCVYNTPQAPRTYTRALSGRLCVSIGLWLSLLLLAAPTFWAPLRAQTLPPIQEFELFAEQGGLGSNDWVKIPTSGEEFGVGYFCVPACEDRCDQQRYIMRALFDPNDDIQNAFWDHAGNVIVLDQWEGGIVPPNNIVDYGTDYFQLGNTGEGYDVLFTLRHEENTSPSFSQKARLYFQFTQGQPSPVPCNARGVDVRMIFQSSLFITGPRCVRPGETHAYFFPPQVSNVQVPTIGTDSYQWYYENPPNLPSAGLTESNPYSGTDFSGDGASVKLTFPSNFGGVNLSVTPGVCNFEDLALTRGFQNGTTVNERHLIAAAPRPMTGLLASTTVSPSTYTGLTSTPTQLTGVCLRAASTEAITLSVPNAQAGITYSWTVTAGFTLTANGGTATITPNTIPNSGGYSGTVTVRARNGSVLCGAAFDQSYTFPINRFLDPAVNTLTLSQTGSGPTESGGVTCLLPGTNYSFTLTNAPINTPMNLSGGVLPSALIITLSGPSNAISITTVPVCTTSACSTASNLVLTTNVAPGGCAGSINARRTSGVTQFRVAGDPGLSITGNTAGCTSSPCSLLEQQFIVSGSNFPEPGCTAPSYTYNWRFIGTYNGVAYTEQDVFPFQFGNSSVSVFVPAGTYSINSILVCRVSTNTCTTSCTDARVTRTIAETNPFYRVGNEEEKPSAPGPRGRRLTLTPNPAEESVVVGISSGKPGERISIVAADGRTVLKARSAGSATTLDLRSLPKGVYTVLYRDEKGQTSRSRLTTK